LRATPDVDVALVDIMMPGLDGFETIREIRATPGLESLPIIAVTAKAMMGDRQKCIDAGASDYVSKPVDIERLISVLRAWTRRIDHSTGADAFAANVVAFPPLASHQ
jgi:CheY-like chemotaxis protein